MRKRTSCMSALAALATLSLTGAAGASSHREAPAISEDPVADNTDTYAWVQGQNLVIVADYIGLELPEGGPNWAKFSDDVLYQVHVVRGGASLDDALTYQIRFKTAAPAKKDENAMPPVAVPAGGIEFFSQLTGSGAFGQTYTVTQLTNGANPTVVASNVPVPPPNVGPKTNDVAFKIPVGQTYESFFVDSGKSTGALNGGGQVFAGPRDDPFFVDLGAVFDLAQLRPIANPTESARNSIAYMNAHAIVLQIPLAVANGGPITNPGTPSTAQTVGVWASASRQKVSILRHGGGAEHFGPWVQVSRLGLPLINEAVIGLGDKDYWNRLTPKADVPIFGGYFLNPIIVRDAQAIGFYAANGPLTAAGCNTTGGTSLETNRLDIIDIINLTNIPSAGAHAIPLSATGDVLRVDLGIPSGFPNGRLLTDTVVDTELGLLLCGAANVGKIAGAGGPQTNEPEAPLPKTSGGNPVFPYLQPPWEGRSANPRTVPNLP